MSDDDRLPSTRQWYALKSKPRKEQSAAAHLSSAGIQVYFPQLPSNKHRGDEPALEPLFPGYLFCHLDPDQGEIRLAKYTYGVLYVVGYGDRPWPVPDDLIESIKQRLDLESRRSRGDLPRPGERVVITSGPLRDLEAVFDRQLTPTGRARVLIKLLNRLCPAELHLRQIRRAK